ncbi:MAG: methionine--tRNA ligase [Crocinitomicaceae bacterium]|nr:methionine--tRNA ligase [Crocinitomicaceae bacterium]
MSGKRHTITAALPYANGPLHLGHVAGVYVPADIYARFLRLQGEDVVFICGSDEHGAAITLRAKKEGTTPQKIVDEYHAINSKSFQNLGISFDIYYRTSGELHHRTAQNFFKKLNSFGSFEERESEQYFDQEHQQFLADRYIKGECPKCQNLDAYGDQCEKCGSALSPMELKNPQSTISGNTPILKKTSHWYLPMQNHETWLKDWIKNGRLNDEVHHDPAEWRNQVIGQCMSWIDGGLQPRAMTRDLDWGVKVPLKDSEGKVLYVWLDAPIGYISATKQWAADNGKDWEPYWKDSSTKLVHFLAKDNIVFHCIIFPILLKEHGDFILPTNVPANEFLNLEGDKFSTSRNWAVWLHEYLDDFPSMQDAMRYVLCAIAPESKDSEFTWKDFQARNNNELADIFGNFINRVLVLSKKYYDGVVPKKSTLSKLDSQVLADVKTSKEKITKAAGNFRFREAQAEAMNLARIGNKYFADTEPWKLIKTDEERVKTVMNIAIQITANLAIAFDPFLPFSTARLREMMNLKKFEWNDFGRDDLVRENHQLGKSEVLFPKIEDAAIQKQIDKLLATKQISSKFPPMKKEIQFEEFTKMDVRVATITEAESHPNADKLLVLKVDTGIDERTIVSGIAEQYKPEEVIGKKVSVLLNLAPRKIRGISSQGMILMAENDGKLTFITPENEIESGAKIK